MHDDSYSLNEGIHCLTGKYTMQTIKKSDM